VKNSVKYKFAIVIFKLHNAKQGRQLLPGHPILN